MDKTLEYKVFATEFKAAGDKGEYEGHFSVFNNLDDGDDVMHEGSFAKTIAERGPRVKVFYAHDWMKLIGPAPTVLKEDPIGLYAQGRLTLESFWGKEAWALMKDNALNEGSIGYEPVKWDYEAKDGNDEWNRIRHLREVKLYEISPVPLGMNALSSIAAMKAALAQNGHRPQGATPGDTPAEKPDADPVAWWAEKCAAAAKELTALKTAVTAQNKSVLRPAVEAMRAALEMTHEMMADESKPKRADTAALAKRLRAAESALALINH